MNLTAIKKEVEKTVAIGNRILEIKGSEAAMYFTVCLSNGVIPILHDNKKDSIYIRLPYKLKKINESNHLLTDNVLSGETEKLNNVFQKHAPSYYHGFSINEILKRQSCGDGKNFYYEFTFDFDQSKKDECLTNIVDAMKSLDVDESDIEKKFRRTNYNKPEIIMLWDLISIANSVVK